jgi:hypothetical protein
MMMYSSSGMFFVNFLTLCSHGMERSCSSIMHNGYPMLDFLARELYMPMTSIVIHDVYKPMKIFFGIVAQVSTKAEENISNIVTISKEHRVIDIFIIIIVSQCLFHTIMSIILVVKIYTSNEVEGF